LRKVTGLNENLYNEAWYRLQNEETSQTLDYTKIKKRQIPEGYEEETGAGEE
jgi:hypothetical protein